MLSRIKKAYAYIVRLLNLNISFNKENIKRLDEIVWAHIYHDTIRGKKHLTELSISPGRWAVNYSFLYLLVRIMEDVKPKLILEFGLGESSKVISTCLNTEFNGGRHVIIEHDPDWIKNFQNRFQLSTHSIIKQTNLGKSIINDIQINFYSEMIFSEFTNFDFFVVDGPFGSEKISRTEIISIAENFSMEKEFIILIDDYNRIGEQRMCENLIRVLRKRKINIATAIFEGSKSQMLIASRQFHFLLSI